ncbi:MAG TPA: ABC transporter substrate-binding protein [Gammaproteobacteria bacterium]
MLAASFAIAGCDGEPPATGAREATIVFKHFRLFGDPAPFAALLREFEAEHPGIRVRAETLPAASDEQHQFYVINLRGGSRDFDVLALDVIWVAEFARAGWIADVTDLLPADEREALFAASLEAVTYEGRQYAVPWFVDAGLLYYRKDLLERHGFAPPRTWTELADAARTIAKREPDVHGFVWQGRQYEGLVCNVLEVIWSAGGDVLDGDRVVLESPESLRALEFVQSLVPRGVSPALVTTATEEPSRHVFGSGRAVFLRNWPYAWTLFQQPDSPVRGKVGVAPLPHFEGHESAAALGGWNLGINARSRHPDAAAEFVRFMASPAAQRTLALAYGYNPARRPLYSDPELLAAQPHLEALRDALDAARSRPVTPRYAQLSQALQSAFSAVVTGLEPPEDALADAQREAERIMAQP